jgi:hypothetical protein
MFSVVWVEGQLKLQVIDPVKFSPTLTVLGTVIIAQSILEEI